MTEEDKDEIRELLKENNPFTDDEIHQIRELNKAFQGGKKAVIKSIVTVITGAILAAIYYAIRHADKLPLILAAAILLLYLGLTFASAAVISAAENLPLGACLYETASAAGTVGLTLGLTPQLGTLSQGILILLMFFGRVGGLTLIYAAFSGHDLTYARYPKEMITVG